jgi:hypothetical protein
MDFSEIGRQFGLNEEQTRAAFEALAPVVANGLRREGGTSGGLSDIIESMTQRGSFQDADAVTAQGNDILGEIFKSKDVSRSVANQLSATSGIGAAILKKMLPVIATIVMGQIMKQMGSKANAGTSGGGLGDILGDILGGGTSRQRPQPSGQGGIEDILKDILGGGAAGGRAPAPRSGQGGIQDILKDILGGGSSGGGRAPEQSAPRRSSGNAADDLLNSVEEALRRR